MLGYRDGVDRVLYRIRLSLVVIQLIRSVPMRSRLGEVIENCREIARHYNNSRLYFIKRSANMLVHELAHVSHMYVS